MFGFFHRMLWKTQKNLLTSPVSWSCMSRRGILDARHLLLCMVTVKSCGIMYTLPPKLVRQGRLRWFVQRCGRMVLEWVWQGEWLWALHGPSLLCGLSAVSLVPSPQGLHVSHCAFSMPHSYNLPLESFLDRTDHI